MSELNASLHPLFATVGSVEDNDQTTLVILFLPEGVEGHASPLE